LALLGIKGRRFHPVNGRRVEFRAGKFEII
jgi:hypothetical protein